MKILIFGGLMLALAMTAKFGSGVEGRAVSQAESGAIYGAQCLVGDSSQDDVQVCTQACGWGYRTHWDDNPDGIKQGDAVNCNDVDNCTAPKSLGGGQCNY